MVDSVTSGRPGKLGLGFQEQEGCLWAEVMPATLCDLQTEFHGLAQILTVPLGIWGDGVLPQKSDVL